MSDVITHQLTKQATRFKAKMPVPENFDDEPAVEIDCSKGPTILVDRFTGESLAFALPDGYLNPVLETRLIHTKYAQSSRMSGLISKSFVFGWQPRQMVKNLCCRKSSHERTDSAVCRQLEEAALCEIEGNFKKALTSKYFKQVDAMQQHITPQWRISQCYTSGIVNFNTGLYYHCDSNNLENTWSCMWTLRSGIIGGYLHLPEYRVVLKLPNRSLLYFNGRETLHGVTQFKKSRPDAYRLTTVWYAIEGLKSCCANIESEVEYFNNRVTTLKLEKARRMVKKKEGVEVVNR